MNKTYDAIVVGSGPAGSTAACGLAQRGRRVIVLDRELFPRYAVGESMLPFCYFPLREIGMLEKMKASAFVSKCSVQFVREDGRVIGAHPDGEMMWHTDTPYLRNPHKATTLYGVEIPRVGGNTLFSNQY